MQTDKENDPKSVQDVMQESVLGTIVKKAQLLDKIERYLHELIDTELSAYCHVLNLKDQCLILASHNSAVATLIRYREEELLRVLNKTSDLPQIDRIECVVRVV